MEGIGFTASRLGNSNTYLAVERRMVYMRIFARCGPNSQEHGE